LGTIAKAGLTLFLGAWALSLAAEHLIVRFSSSSAPAPSGSTVSVIDKDHIWIGLVHTADGGQSWSSWSPRDADAGLFNNVEPQYQLAKFITDWRGWLSWSSVWQTEDGGGSWSWLFAGHVHAMAFAPGSAGWMAVGDGRSVRYFHTSDLGTAWHQCGETTLKDGAPLDSASFIDEKTGWATYAKYNDRELPIPPVGVARTDDGGCTWKTLWIDAEEPPYQLGTISFANDTFGWLSVTGYGGLLATSDGGFHWRSLPLPTQRFMVQSAFLIGRADGWILGHSASTPESDSGLYRTSDGGLHWEAISKNDLRDDRAAAREVPIGWSEGYAAKVMRRYYKPK